jgi:hypothetical protein
MKDFLTENKEVFDKLAIKIREIDTVFVKNEKEMFARQRAIEIIMDWMEELWGIEKKDFKEFYEDINKEDDMFKYRTD